jgi:purine-binding chemotaxis protein CheW
MRNSSANGDPRAEMDEVIDIEGEGDAHQTLSVFQCERLLERLAREIPALAA